MEYKKDRFLHRFGVGIFDKASRKVLMRVGRKLQRILDSSSLKTMLSHMREEKQKFRSDPFQRSDA